MCLALLSRSEQHTCSPLRRIADSQQPHDQVDMCTQFYLFLKKVYLYRGWRTPDLRILAQESLGCSRTLWERSTLNSRRPAISCRSLCTLRRSAYHRQPGRRCCFQPLSRVRTGLLRTRITGAFTRLHRYLR